MIDFHCHLDLFADPAAVAREAQRRNIGLLSVTTTPSAWPGTLAVAHGYSVIRTALGLHPQLARERTAELSLFEKYLPDARYVGEVGLDGSPELSGIWDYQTRVFDAVLRACVGAGGRILSIHSRRAVAPVLDALSVHADAGTPILHWFSGTKSELHRAVAGGCWFSVGPAMLRGAKGRALIESIPHDRVVLETDGPFAQIGGRSLHPWDVRLAHETLSEIWALDIAATGEILRGNELTLLA